MPHGLCCAAAVPKPGAPTRPPVAVRVKTLASARTIGQWRMGSSARLHSGSSCDPDPGRAQGTLRHVGTRIACNGRLCGFTTAREAHDERYEAESVLTLVPQLAKRSRVPPQVNVRRNAVTLQLGAAMASLAKEKVFPLATAVE